MSLYSLEPATLFSVPTTDRLTNCRLCHLPAIPYEDRPDINLGPLYQYGKPVTGDDGKPDLEIYCAHYYCLLFSPGLETKGEDEEGIRGFLPEDILREWRRGARLKCIFCDKKYATIGCCIGKICRKTYHLPCGLKNGVQIEFLEGFKSFCIEHRHSQDIYSNTGPDLLESEDRECGVCLENLPKISEQDEEERRRTLHSPCCNGWFHKSCAERAAEVAGYFFKCPLCNSKDIFEHEMKKFGVYVPEQDAAWELEGGQFEELLERHDRCDAETCVCPDGRHEDEDYTIWEIILCRYCGAQGIHVECGGLELRDDVTWKCPGCVDVVKRLPPKTRHRFRKMNRKKSSKKKLVANLLKSTVIRVGPTDNGASTLTFNIRSKKLTASIDRVNKFDVPKPVQLFKPVPNEIVVQKEAPNVITSSQIQTPEIEDSKTPSNLFLEFFTAIEEPTPNVKDGNSGIADSIVNVDTSIEKDVSIPHKSDNSENENIHVEPKGLAEPSKRGRGRSNKVSSDTEEKTSCPDKNKNPKKMDTVDLAKPIKRRGRPNKVSSEEEKKVKEHKTESTVSDVNDTREGIESTEDDDVMEEVCAIFENKMSNASSIKGLTEVSKSPRKNEPLKSKADSPFSFEMIARKKAKSDSSQRKNLSVLSKLSSGLQDSIEPQVVSTNSNVSKKRKLSHDNRNEQSDMKKAKVETNVVMKFLDKNSNNDESKSENTSDSTDVTSPPSANGPKSCKAKKLLKNVDPNQKTILQYFISRSNPM